MITNNEILNTLNPLNNGYFCINDLNEYANKVIKLGKSIVIRNSHSELLSYVLYYDNGPDIFITMVWTKAEQQGKGLAKELIHELINNHTKEILLEVNQHNPAINLYRKLKFVEESKNGENLILRYSRSLCIMQPYIFPYVGYFHLIEATDKIVFYDDVTYIKGGWINRNRILINGKDTLFTIPLLKASSNKLISETELHPTLYPVWKIKFLKTIEQNYSKAPYFAEIYNLIDSVLDLKSKNTTDLAINSISAIYNYLNKEINWTKSSICSPETKGQEKADRIINITKDLGYVKYVNSNGGQELYSKSYFNNEGLQLNFVQSKNITYKQFNKDFVPSLSIIDLLMFNEKKTIKEQFTAYNIV